MVTGFPTVGVDAAAVTTSDSTVVSFRGLYIGGAGDVAVVTLKGTTVTFPACPAGFILPVAVTKVLAATTATNIVGIF